MTNHTLPEIEIAKEETLRSNQREQLINASINPYKHTFNRSHLIHNVIKLHQSIQAGESTNSAYTIAGRLIAKRGHGKALFGNIQDDSGTIQFYANINDIADHLFQQIEHVFLWLCYKGWHQKIFPILKERRFCVYEILP